MTEKQRKARNRNWYIFYLRGVKRFLGINRYNSDLTRAEMMHFQSIYKDVCDVIDLLVVNNRVKK